MPSNNKDVQGWIFSPKFLAILQVTNIVSAIYSFMKRKRLPRKAYDGRTEVYSDLPFLLICCMPIDACRSDIVERLGDWLKTILAMLPL